MSGHYVIDPSALIQTYVREPQTEALSALLVHFAPAYLSEAIDIGLDHGLAIYDALYIVLAQKLQTALITTDKKQMRVAQQIGVAIKPVTDFA